MHNLTSISNNRAILLSFDYFKMGRDIKEKRREQKLEMLMNKKTGDDDDDDENEEKQEMKNLKKLR